MKTILWSTNVVRFSRWLKQESVANAKVSARRNSLNRPPLRIAQKYQRNLYIVEKYFQCSTIPSLTMLVYLHSFSRCCLPNVPTSANFRKKLALTAVQGHPRSMILVPIESAYATSYEWLIVTLSYLAPFLRYGDLFAENCVFFIPLSVIRRPASYVLFGTSEFRGEVKRQETRVIGLLCGEGCVMILTSTTVFDWSTRVTDRRTGNSI